jgi:hypothetical protein
LEVIEGELGEIAELVLEGLSVIRLGLLDGLGESGAGFEPVVNGGAVETGGGSGGGNRRSGGEGGSNGLLGRSEASVPTNGGQTPE